jgi:diguanylate cyclase (GGDEF)-like protein/PAS domain S-box-containing protein
MSTVVNLLVIEDSEDDARLAIQTLRRGGFDVRHERVESVQALREALPRRAWDAIISDFNLPGFTGMDVLAIFKAHGRDIPFIVVSGTIGEEAAVEAMKAGACDYVLKKDLARLAPALDRELKEAAIRAELRRSQNALAASELRLRTIIDSEPECVKVVGADGRLQEMNPAGLAILEAESLVEVQDRPLGEYLPPEYRAAFSAFHERVIGGTSGTLEFEVIGLKGTRRWLEAHAAPLPGGEGEATALLAISRDITSRKLAERELRRFHMAMDLSADSIYLTDLQSLRFVYLNEAACRRLGYTREQLLQKSPQDVLGVDREQIRLEFDEVVSAGDAGVLVERRFVMQDGGQGWTELHRRALETVDGTLIATIGRDITGRKADDERIRRLNRVYAVLSGINALIVRAHDRDELFREVSRIAVEAGGFRLAWLGLVDREAMRIQPIAWQGVGEDFIRSIRMELGEDAPGDRGYAARAVVERKAIVIEDMMQDPRARLKERALEHGFRSVAVLPLLLGGEAVGVMVLYTSEAGFFDAEEMKLLTELAGDIAFALDHIEKASRLDYLAYYDSLTGLANRRLFHERLEQHLHATKEEGKCALALMNVERFKAINDSLGRQAGDALLSQLGQRLIRAARQENVARFGGDNFAILLPEIKGRSEALRRIERIWHECFGPPFCLNGAELRVVAKSGIALHPNDGADAEALVASAESALKKAQKSGERHEFHSRALSAGAAARFALENQLRQALEKEEFVLHYQPKVDLDTRAIVGVEALIRWQSPELGLVPPMKFIPLLEETGMILEVGAWALKRASLDHRLWVEQQLKAPRIAVNVSPIQLRQRDFVSAVEQAIMEGVAPTGIDLEITESLIMEDVQASIEKLKKVRGLGVRIAIDDFGTGYSSLGYLAKLPVQTLKIDRSFIITMLEDADTMTLVQTIISLAHALRLKVVAEGVDAEDQAKLLRLLRCDEMQGYLFSRPLPFDAMTALLAAQVAVPGNERVTLGSGLVLTHGNARPDPNV